ncbi:hypothetical protein [Prescottella subtropica]|uniref:hypothetical protein n=1 Tax=Prescottella subtropica TaxID=2545757 RepID=UPI0010F8A93C|nr:hypothetical protein [Prescottella subtropica]
MTDNLSWPEIGALVDAGQLTMEPGTAEQCAARCTRFIEQLQAIKIQSGELTRIDGLGHLPSGIALARKFEQKASGGEYSLDQALDDNISVVKQMRAVFEKIAADYNTAEESNTQALNVFDTGN